MPRLLLTAMAFLVAAPAFAYIGPGAGVGFFGSILTTLGMILLAILAILVWPLRWALRRMRAKARQTAPDDSKKKLPPSE